MTRLFFTWCAAALAAFCLTGCDVDVEDPGEMPAVDVEATPGEMPDVDARGPEVDVTQEEREITVPDVDVDVQEQERKVDLPDVDVTLPEEDDQRDPRDGI